MSFSDSQKTRWALFFFLLSMSVFQTSCGPIPLNINDDRRESYKYEHPLDVQGAEFLRSLASQGPPMVAGNTAVLLENGDEIFPAMTSAIRRASQSVNLESYIFNDDEAGRLFTDALTEVAKKGVEVRVLIDGIGSSLGSLANDMKVAGIKVRTYRPINPFTIHRIGKRTHRKILVIDGKEAFTGGLGIDKRWLGNSRNTKEWRDTQVHVTGPVVAGMQAIFSEDWTYTSGEILSGDRFYPKLEPTGSVLAQAIKTSRGDSSSLAKLLYYVAIQSSAKSIHIENAYFLPDKQIRKALVDAVARGVDVQVLVPGRHIDVSLVRSASRSHYGELLKGGVKIFEYRPSMMHKKTMVVDGIYSIIGSINLDSRSMNKNAEASLGFYDREFSRKLEQSFEGDLKRSQPVTYEQWKHRGLWARLAEFTFGWWELYY